MLLLLITHVKWEFTQQQTEQCAVLAKRFDGISVREKSGVALCNKYLGVNATHVLDPTLLMKSQDYIKLCSHISKREPFIFAYVLDESEEKIKSIVRFAECRGLPYIIKGADNTVSDDDTIELWLSYFRDAAFVVTDSFLSIDNVLSRSFSLSTALQEMVIVIANRNSKNSLFFILFFIKLLFVFFCCITVPDLICFCSVAFVVTGMLQSEKRFSVLQR